jgi:acyl dehydratase
MTIATIGDVEFGTELPTFDPDTSLAATARFADAVGWGRGGRFKDHDKARKEGLPGALVPGIMGMGVLTTMIHRWCPVAKVEHVDTVFRAPMLADEPVHINAVVTDVDEEAGVAELDLTIRNDAGETRVFGTARIRLPRTAPAA